MASGRLAAVRWRAWLQRRWSGGATSHRRTRRRPGTASRPGLSELVRDNGRQDQKRGRDAPTQSVSPMPGVERRNPSCPDEGTAPRKGQGFLNDRATCLGSVHHGAGTGDYAHVMRWLAVVSEEAEVAGTDLCRRDVHTRVVLVISVSREDHTESAQAEVDQSGAVQCPVAHPCPQVANPRRLRAIATNGSVRCVDCRDGEAVGSRAKRRLDGFSGAASPGRIRLTSSRACRYLAARSDCVENSGD